MAFGGASRLFEAASVSVAPNPVAAITRPPEVSSPPEPERRPRVKEEHIRVV